MAPLEVACGIILKDKLVLATQRSELMSLPLKWELPGGKIKKQETAQQCLHRELFEELRIKVVIKKQLKTTFFQYEQFSINLIPFVVDFVAGPIILVEHKDFKWLKISEVLDLNWADADKLVLKEFLTLFSV